MLSTQKPLLVKTIPIMTYNPMKDLDIGFHVVFYPV